MYVREREEGEERRSEKKEGREKWEKRETECRSLSVRAKSSFIAESQYLMLLKSDVNKYGYK